MGAVAKRIGITTHFIRGYNLDLMDCAHCGEVFAVLSSTVELRRRDENAVYCPHGHNLKFSIEKSFQQRELDAAKKRADEAERQADSARQAREWAERSARGARIAAGKAKARAHRLTVRVGNGVCPCCNRTFKQLAAHMASQHPEFKTSEKPVTADAVDPVDGVVTG